MTRRPGSPHPTRNLCVFGEGQIDRSATGSGVTARMAVDAARGLIGQASSRAFAGASGVPFDGELLAEEPLGPHRAWRVRVSGTASFQRHRHLDRRARAIAWATASPLRTAGPCPPRDEPLGEQAPRAVRHCPR